MNETLGRGYARIDAIRAARGEPPASGSDPAGPPPDRYNSVYITLFVAGAAFLLPFNSFIMAVDYFQHHYPNSTIMFDMSTVYIASACVAVVVNNLVLDIFSNNTRITFGILVSLSTMLFVAVCNIGWDGFSPRASYTITLVAIGVVAVGCTVQQASYYGFTGSLPPRYTQAVMVGESAAGFWVSIDRILTKYTFKQPRRSTFMFFVFSILILLGHSMLHHMMMRHPLVLHYLRLTSESRHKRRILLHLNPSQDNAVESQDGESSYGVLKLQSPAPSSGLGDAETKTFGFSNPVYSPTSSAPAQPPATPPLDAEDSPGVLRTPRPSYKVEDVVHPTERHASWSAFKRGVAARWMVGRAIYPYMVSIGLVYFTTLSLYPGIASEVPSCRLGTWMPIVLMSAFNFFDFVGKIAAAYPYEWSRSQLLMASGVRLLLVPLMLLCAAPRHAPHIVGDEYPIFFSVVLGFSNGLFGSVPMIMAPSRVSREHREIAGNMMTLSYNGGLLSGSLVSYLLLGILGPPTEPPCRVYPTPPLPTIPTTSTTLASNVTQMILSMH
ncbi:equilibrative nucleoside transporter 4 isoform X2 [Plutella xylostella]|uniref:equilibrative nucleoside transporter 4 isoform X1 n=1 Tax=Plutella xylostella TaxID=51655 RepID=UPI0018D17344|nr:equilibrative nucleoside transporter 4 isoform X1 [Plutella xylostella]XP_048487631.1 equilibrative nucleoside transporter 4 isoform X2 [Plutella xylostella]